MVCLACTNTTVDVVCSSCRRALAPGPVRRLGTRFVVIAGTRHQGPARRLVHRLKYQGVGAAAELLGAIMARSVPPGTSQLVPVPRALVRRGRYGSDPARLLAAAVSRHTGEAEQILMKRKEVYEQAKRRNPSRWSGTTRNWEPVVEVRLNPSVGKQHSAATEQRRSA